MLVPPHFLYRASAELIYIAVFLEWLLISRRDRYIMETVCMEFVFVCEEL
jgi:hypothetical protein